MVYLRSLAARAATAFGHLDGKITTNEVKLGDLDGLIQASAKVNPASDMSALRPDASDVVPASCASCASCTTSQPSFASSASRPA